MILRKPYAILIKYFKPIHILMFIFFSYFVFALRKIYIFFSTYIKTSNFTYIENMSNIYVPWILFLFVILLLALSIGIFLLMNKKEKPVLFYRVMIGYCVFLLVILIYYVVFFKSLDNTIYEPLRIVVNRDISLFAYLINFFFVAVTFIRGFGFDIKKFSFDKDKKELHLEESDSEEYELNVRIEKDDIKSFVNRNRREFRYYFKENKLIFTIIGIILLVFLSLYVYFNFFVINKIYVEGDDVKVNNLIYRVNSSIVTNIDKYGNEISATNAYLIIDMNIINNQGTGYLDGQALRINIDQEYYYPSTTACDLFSDLGNCYKNQELKVNTDNNFVVIYKIKKEYKNVYLEILKNISDEYQYSKVKLSCVENKPKELNRNLNEEIMYENGVFMITNYTLLNKTTYKYEDCIEDKCKLYTKVVSPNTGEIVLVLEFNNTSNFSDDFINSAFGVKYNDMVYTGKEIKLISQNENTIYYSVPAFLESVSNFYLTVTTRDNRYNVLLGGK